MITKLTLVNIRHHTVTELFVLVMKAFKIYSFSNFKKYHTLLLSTIVPMLYVISP